MRRILGGNATRAEVYALFIAAVVLLGGAVGGAIVVTQSENPTATVPLESTITMPETTSTSAAPTTTGPTTTTSSTRLPQPVPVPPVAPVQDFIEFCVLPDLSGDQGVVARKLQAAGCLFAPDPSHVNGITCHRAIPDSESSIGIVIIGQDPAAGTMMHRTLGTLRVQVAIDERHRTGTFFPSPYRERAAVVPAC